MGQFVFNEHDVCTNCNKDIVLNEKYFFAEIYTAEYENNWYAGYNWNLRSSGYEGGGCGPYKGKNAKAYGSEAEARRYIVQFCFIKKLERAIEYLKKPIGTHQTDDEDPEEVPVSASEKIRILTGYIDRCREYIQDTYQLSLF